MIKYIMEKIETERVKETHRYCDLCGTEIKLDNWDAFEFILREGHAYPESGSGTEQTVDLCPNCARKLFKYLREMGIRINEREWFY